MKHILSLAEITASDHEVVGGKALALARSAMAGLPVPCAVCITTGAYREYLEGTGLAGRIIMELGRKDFAETRWGLSMRPCTASRAKTSEVTCSWTAGKGIRPEGSRRDNW